jgi:hypothetical protein
MKKVVLASFALYAAFQLEAANADFKVVENPTPGQQIYWTMQNDKSSPCAWYEAWEVLAVQNGVVKLKKVKSPSVSFTDEEHYSELGKLSSWSSEEDAKRSSDANKCHLKHRFEGK